MKKLILIAAVALMALPAAAQVQEAFPSYIQVNGRAEKEITPDEFYLSVIINERDSKGKISVESQQRDMIAALKRLGVNVEKQLKVANLSSEFFKKNTSVATAKYQLQLGSAAEVSKVWQALDNLGISNVSILKVSHSKIDQYKEQVRVEAMQNAKQSAQTLAQAIGQSVGKCFYIYDSNNNVMPVFYDNMAVMRSAKAAGLAEDAAADEREKHPGCWTIAKFILSLFTLPLKTGGVMEKQFCFNYEHYAALAGLSDADRRLVAEAQRATENAHAPYSHFRVGAAARLRSGKILYGSNFESEVYPAGLCAERSLMFYAQANYADDPIETLAIASNPSARECYPCGQCRQVMVDVERRQGSPMRVIMSGNGTATVVDTAARLLPFTFVL